MKPQTEISDFTIESAYDLLIIHDKLSTSLIMRKLRLSRTEARRVILCLSKKRRRFKMKGKDYVRSDLK